MAEILKRDGALERVARWKSPNWAVGIDIGRMTMNRGPNLQNIPIKKGK